MNKNITTTAKKVVSVRETPAAVKEDVDMKKVGAADPQKEALTKMVEVKKKGTLGTGADPMAVQVEPEAEARKEPGHGDDPGGHEHGNRGQH